MLLVREAKEKGIIPEPYWDIVPEVCEGTCGKPLEVTSNLTTVRCTDPRCIHKLAGRGASMLQSLGIKGVGKSYCEKYILSNGYASHLGLLLGTDRQHMGTGHSVTGLRLKDAVENIQSSRRFTFPSLVTLMSLPYLGTRAQQIFKGVNSYEEWLHKLEESNTTPYEYICNLDGFGVASAERICETLKTFDSEMRTITKVFRVKTEPLWKYNVAVTGTIENIPFAFTRNQFERYLNTIGEGMVAVRFSKSLKTCDYIIADNLEKDNEYTYTTTSSVGMAREEHGEEEVLITSDIMVKKIQDDVAYLKECAEEWYRERKKTLET